MSMNPESLTNADRELIQDLASGMAVKEIAAQSRRSLKSVESQTYRLKKKLGVSDRAEIARMAIELGLVSSAAIIGRAPSPDVLTDRQREVLALVGAGFRMKDVARLSGLSERAAGSHKDRGMFRLDLHDRVELMHYCSFHGLVPAASLELATDRDHDGLDASGCPPRGDEFLSDD